MMLWKMWFEAVASLRPACARAQTYAWMVVILIGLSIRADLAGVTSIVRVLGLLPRRYSRLLHLFHFTALELDRLTELWVRWCRRNLPIMTVGPHSDSRSSQEVLLRPVRKARQPPPPIIFS
jgi:hypothetical protein